MKGIIFYYMIETLLKNCQKFTYRFLRTNAESVVVKRLIKTVFWRLKYIHVKLSMYCTLVFSRYFNLKFIENMKDSVWIKRSKCEIFHYNINGTHIDLNALYMFTIWYLTVSIITESNVSPFDLALFYLPVKDCLLSDNGDILICSSST